MSNVTLQEIVDLTADAFSIPRSQFRAKGKATGRNSWEQFARYCAAMLARRHTEARWTTITRALGTSIGGRQSDEAAETVSRFEADAKRFAALGRIVAGIEEKIDRLHEERADAVQNARRASTASRTARFASGGHIAAQHQSRPS